jgi:hypothetical protein
LEETNVASEPKYLSDAAKYPHNRTNGGSQGHRLRRHFTECGKNRLARPQPGITKTMACF